LLFYYTAPAAAEAVIPAPTPEDLAVGTLVSRLLLRLKLPKSERPLLLVPLRAMLLSALVIPSLGNQGGSSVAPTAKGSHTRDSWGKGVMVDDAAASSSGVSRPRPSS
nr:hypothetical protein [Tanacetum cinerariifolium]